VTDRTVWAPFVVVVHVQLLRRAQRLLQFTTLRTTEYTHYLQSHAACKWLIVLCERRSLWSCTCSCCGVLNASCSLQPYTPPSTLTTYKATLLSEWSSYCVSAVRRPPRRGRARAAVAGCSAPPAAPAVSLPSPSASVSAPPPAASLPPPSPQPPQRGAPVPPGRRPPRAPTSSAHQPR